MLCVEISTSFEYTFLIVYKNIKKFVSYGLCNILSFTI